MENKKNVKTRKNVTKIKERKTFFTSVETLDPTQMNQTAAEQSGPS